MPGPEYPTSSPLPDVYESVETDLFGYLHPAPVSGLLARMRSAFRQNDTDADVYSGLMRLDFHPHQLDSLMLLRQQTRGLDVAAFTKFLFTHRSEFAAVFPGFISCHDHSGFERICEPSPLNDLLRNRRVALVGPSEHLDGSESASRIESYDVVVRLNNQWPVPRNLRSDVGERMDVLFHCCNNDTSIDRIFCDEIQNTQLICYELGVSAFRLVELAGDRGVPLQCVSSTYRDLACQLGTHPNTGTAAVALLLKSQLKELFITGMTFFQDPYSRGYRGVGNQRRHWRFGRPPRSIGTHDLTAQLEFAMKLLRKESRVTLDARLGQIVARSEDRVAGARSSTVGSR
jgi:hypothetical protein